MEVILRNSGKDKKLTLNRKSIIPLAILQKENIRSDRIISSAKVNNLLVSLKHRIEKDCTLEFIDISSYEGLRVYQDSLCFVLVRAAKELFQKARVIVKHSLADGYYIEIYSRFLLTESDTMKLKRKLHTLVDNNEKMELIETNIEKARKIFKNDKIKLGLLKYYKFKKIILYKFDTIYNYFNGPLVPSTGFLQIFDIKYVPPGLVLRFPTTEYPDKIAPFQQQPNLLKIFTEYERWGDILDLSYVASLNNTIENFQINEIIKVSEALHEKKIAQIAEDIYQKRKKIKIILISGPSSSGKSTFAQRLNIQLKTNGISSTIITLDDYFHNREKTPRDKNGEYNFECLEALDNKLINKHVKKLIKGEVVEIPKFNFISGRREKYGQKVKLEPGTLLILEGIHGLNDRLTPSIPRKNKYKIYVSALTQINLDNHNRISTSDTRIIRRIVRDFPLRGYTARETIKRWKSIRDGERKYVFSFQEESDAMFNSALPYELGVLKKYAIPRLAKISPEAKEYSTAQRLINLLSFFEDVPENDIPRNSIIKEFISNVSYEY